MPSSSRPLWQWKNSHQKWTKNISWDSNRRYATVCLFDILHLMGFFIGPFEKPRSFDETFRQDIADRRAKALFDRRSILLDTQSSLVRRGRNGRCQTSTLGLENLLFGRCNFPIRCYHWIHDFFLGFQLKSRFCVFLLVNETMLTGVGGLEVRFLVERHSLLSLKGIESAFLRLKFAVWTLGMIQRIAL